MTEEMTKDMMKEKWYKPKTKWDYFIASGLIVNMIVVLVLVISYIRYY